MGLILLRLKALREDPDLIEFPVKTRDEPRFLVLAIFPESIGRELSFIGVKRSGLFRCEEPDKRRLIFMKAKEFDKKLDEGEDISKYLDLTKKKRPKQEQKRVNVDFPLWMVHLLDKEANRLGVPRQAIIKIWVAERLEKTS